MNQLPVIQDMDYFLDAARLNDTAERAARKVLNSDIAAIKGILPIVFILFKQGILYVYERFGTVAEHFTLDGDTVMHKIGDGEGHTLNYVPELDCIAIDYMSLGIICMSILSNRKVSFPAIEYWGTDFYISAKDAVFLGGVEEAHHAYHIKSGGEYTKCETMEELKNDPAELAAGKVIRQAVRELGIQLYIFKNGHFSPRPCPLFF